ncbi:MAG: hypothetical protein QY318_01485 [Candidatus Dojkabacteria bacterium]|nr:MAG: hypothetical protein QY318_01485 [Candidatus Dojkabacteria bacterium]
MEIKVLQGVNFEAPHTLIKISLDGDAGKVTPLLDLVKSFHHVLLKEYVVDGSTVILNSKLTHLWKSSAEHLNKLSLGELSQEEVEEYVIGYTIKNQIYSMSTLFMLEGAIELGEEVTQSLFNGPVFDDPSYEKPGGAWNRVYTIGAGSAAMLTKSTGSTGDPIMALNIQRDKWVTNTYADRLKLPVAKWDLLRSEEEVERLFEEYEKPVVIKPTGLVGGNGVTTNINTLEQAKKAYNYAYDIVHEKNRSAWQQKIMIQQQVAGEDYRLLVVGGILEIATKRIPAFVTGDGKSTLEQLIEETNRDPRRDMRNPAHILKPIAFDEKLDEYLAEQNLSLDHIPGEGEKIFVRKVASMSQGGITEDFTDKVHPQIKYLAESMASSIHAHVVGIDVICKDISKPLTADNGSFIEMNTMPEAYLNTFPVIGKQYPETGQVIIKRLLEKMKPVTRIVAIGLGLPELFEKLENEGVIVDDAIVGTVSGGSIYIDSEIMHEDVETWEAVEALKLNALPSVLVLHYKDADEVEEVGLGFDKVDYLIANDEVSEKLSGEGYKSKVLNFIKI